MKDDVTTLKVMTLNTWGFRWPLAKHRGRRFQRIAQHLNAHEYDVVGLQELWDNASRMLDHALAWTRRSTQYRQRRGLRVNDSGLGFKVCDALDGEATVVADGVRPFSTHRGWDRLKHKGMMTVSVPTEAGDVAVINTHLQAGDGHGRVRRVQLDELFAVVDAIEEPVILLGDFNLHRDSAEDRAAERALDRMGFRDAAPELDDPQPTYLRANPYVGRANDERFDRIYIRDGAEASLLPQSVSVFSDHGAPMSDHEAFSAEIAVSRR